jgi:hypothetical protein
MTTSQDWGVVRRLAFRFGVIFGGLLIFPFPLGSVPKTDWLATALNKPLEWATQWLATAVLGLPEQPTTFNGSGDRTVEYVQLLLYAILAVVGTIAWSVIDRRRKAYPRLAGLAHMALRYSVSAAMLGYGFSKILRQQFGDLTPYTLSTRVGEMSPMGLLWRFMDYSTPYTVFAGLAEAIAGVLLLWRRTATLGALLAIAVMTNVVLLNFCYDVPVKLYSTQLLVFAALIALPSARRVLAVILGGAASEVPARTRMSPRRERIRQITKIAFVACLAWGVYQQFIAAGDRGDPHELYARWLVDSFSVDGVEQTQVTAGPPVRWQRLAASATYAAIWLVTGERDVPAGPRGVYPWKVDSKAHTIEVTIDAKADAKETWHYTRPTPDQLVIDAPHRGKQLHVTLHREPDPLLLTRGFRWINEAPFNR